MTLDTEMAATVLFALSPSAVALSQEARGYGLLMLLATCAVVRLVRYAVLAETKPNQQEQLKFKREELRKYFPSGYTEEQMRRDIIKGLELLKRQRERNRDAR